MTADVDYHLRRARSERDTAYRSADDCASEAHMRLSALHLERALRLQEVRRVPVGNVLPFKSNSSEDSGPAELSRLIELPGREVG